MANESPLEKRDIKSHESPLEKRDNKSHLDERGAQAESFLLALDAASRYAEIRAQTHEVLGHRLRSRLARRDGARIRRLIAQQGLDDAVARGHEVVADPGEVEGVAMESAELPGLHELPPGQDEPIAAPEGGDSDRGDEEAIGLELGAGMLVPVVLEPEIAVSSSSESGDGDLPGLEKTTDDDRPLVDEADVSTIPAGDGEPVRVMDDGDFDLEAGQVASAVAGMSAEEQWLLDQLGAAAFLLGGDEPAYERDDGADAVLAAESPEPLLVEPLALDSLSLDSEPLDVLVVEELFLLDELGPPPALLEGGETRRVIAEDDGFDLDDEPADTLGFGRDAGDPTTSAARALDVSTEEDVFVLDEIDATSASLQAGDSGQGFEESDAVERDEEELADPLDAGREVVESPLSGSVTPDEPVTEGPAPGDSPLLAEVAASRLPLEAGDSGSGVEKGGMDVDLEPEGSGSSVVGPGAVETSSSESLVLGESVAEGSRAAEPSLLGDGLGVPVKRDDSGRGVEERGGVEFGAEISEPLTAEPGAVESPLSESVVLGESVAEGSGSAEPSLLGDGLGVPVERDDSGRGVEERGGVEFGAEISEPLTAEPGAVESPLSESVVLGESVAEGSGAAEPSLLGDGLGVVPVEQDDSGRGVEERGAFEFGARGSRPADTGRKSFESLAHAPDRLDDPPEEDVQGSDEVGASPSSLKGHDPGGGASEEVDHDLDADVSEPPAAESPVPRPERLDDPGAEHVRADDSRLFDWIDAYTRPLERVAGEGTGAEASFEPSPGKEPVEALTSEPETLGVPAAEDSLLLDQIAVYTFPLEGGDPGYGGVELDAEVSERPVAGREAEDPAASRSEGVDGPVAEDVLSLEPIGAYPSSGEREDSRRSSEQDGFESEAETPAGAEVAERWTGDPVSPTSEPDAAAVEASRAERSGLLDLLVAYTKPLEGGDAAAPGEEGSEPTSEAENPGPSTAPAAEDSKADDSDSSTRASAYRFPFRHDSARTWDVGAVDGEDAQVPESPADKPEIVGSPAADEHPPAGPAAGSSRLLARLRAYSVPREPAGSGRASQEGSGPEHGAETGSSLVNPADKSSVDDDSIILDRLGAYTFSSEGPLSIPDSEGDQGVEAESTSPEPPPAESPSVDPQLSGPEAHEDPTAAEAGAAGDIGADARDDGEARAAELDAGLPEPAELEPPDPESPTPETDALDAQAAEVSAEAKTLLLERISAYTFRSAPKGPGRPER